ncbi:MAG: hypothetical protein ACXVAY_07800 [Mucilaginibacter sp.]
MKKTILPLLLIAAIYSCKKGSTTGGIPLKLLPDSNIVVSTPAINPLNTRFTHVDTTYNLLGYGYDITGKYADTSAVRGQAINVRAYDVNNPGRFVPDLSTTATFHLINAESAVDFSHQISSRLNESSGLSLFKGSIVSAFAGTNALSSKYVYGSYTMIIQQKRVKMMQNIDLIKNYLTATFISDSQTLSAADLVKKYGTHILADVVLGARLNIMYQAQSNASGKLASSTAGMRYALARVFGLSTGALDPINTIDLAAVSSPVLVYEATGADQSKLKLNTSTTVPTLNTNNWHLSSTYASAVFIDISPNGLLPLDALISDPVKQAAVKSYIASYLASEQVKLVN